MESAVDTGSLGNPDLEAPRTKLAALGGQPAGQPAAPLPPAATSAQTGVNPGGQGYNSGQVDPAAVAASSNAAATPSGTATGYTTTSLGTFPTGPGGSGVAPAGAPLQIASALPSGRASVVPAVSSPVANNLAAFGGAPTGTPVAAATPAPAPGPAPGSTTASPGGTTNGYNPLTSGAIGSSGVGPALNSLTGGILQTQQADLSGVHAAQNADYGEAQSLGQERYDYTPGAAPSQSGVQLSAGPADQTRTQQQTALTALGAAANGAVPSAAELQLRQQAAKNEAANLGAARALGGRSAGGVARAATVANAGANAQTNLDAAQTRATEQATARQQQIAALSGVRDQDVTQAQTQAQLDQARNQNNLTAQVTTNAQTEAQKQALLQAQLTAMGQGTTAAGAGATASAANAAGQNAAKGGFLSTLGSLASL